MWLTAEATYGRHPTTRFWSSLYLRLVFGILDEVLRRHLLITESNDDIYWGCTWIYIEDLKCQRSIFALSCACRKSKVHARLSFPSEGKVEEVEHRIHSREPLVFTEGVVGFMDDLSLHTECTSESPYLSRWQSRSECLLMEQSSVILCIIGKPSQPLVSSSITLLSYCLKIIVAMDLTIVPKPSPEARSARHTYRSARHLGAALLSFKSDRS